MGYFGYFGVSMNFFYIGLHAPLISRVLQYFTAVALLRWGAFCSLFGKNRAAHCHLYMTVRGSTVISYFYGVADGVEVEDTGGEEGVSVGIISATLLKPLFCASAYWLELNSAHVASRYWSLPV